MNCPVCKQSHFYWFRAVAIQEYGKGDVLPAWICKKCGVLFLEVGTEEGGLDRWTLQRKKQREKDQGGVVVPPREGQKDG